VLNISFHASFDKESWKGMQEIAGELNSMKDYITSVWLCSEFSTDVTLVFMY
jgi:hypothetical protein